MKDKLVVSRRKEILEQAKREGEVLIAELSRKFEVTEVTIRNDLDFLEKKNLIMRARGGAILVENNVGTDQNIMEKSKLHMAEKRIIGMKSAQLIADDETIILDSGTTTAEIAKNLDDIKNLTVVTNAINIVSILAGKMNVTLIVPGGVLRQKSSSLVGPVAESNFKNFFVDKAFISADGFDINQGIFTPNIDEASLNRIMINSAKEVILVTDSSKFLRRSLVLICGFNKINTVVTDSGIPKEAQKRLLDHGVEIIIE